jgi:hypothetical protein
LGKRETTFKEGNSIMKQLYGNQVNSFETGWLVLVTKTSLKFYKWIYKHRLGL